MQAIAFLARNNRQSRLYLFFGKDGFFVLFSSRVYVIIILYVTVEVIYLNTERIRDLLLGWYADHFRALPWRVDASPYLDF